MFDALKRAYTEIIESVLQPLKGWILRRSWFVRFLFVIAVALAGLAYWKPQTAAGIVDRATYSVRSLSSRDDFPLSGRAEQSLALAVRRLSPSVEADLSTDLNESQMTPWSASQSVLALRSAGQPVPDAAAYVAFVNSHRHDPDCFCWAELPDEPRTMVVSFVGGWVMAAFAGIDAPIAPADYDYVLQRQSPAGWWPMFSESEASQFASTYSTAWILLGLHRQREAGLVPPERRPAVDRSMRRAQAWLMRSREGARWKAHPTAPSPEEPETLSGLVLYVLHEVGSRDDLKDVDRAWLDAVPKQELTPSSLQKHYTILPAGHRQMIDHFVEIRLPWILLATAAAYPSGSPPEKARTLTWLEQVLRNPEVRGADTEGVEWVRAEVLLGLAETARKTGCTNCLPRTN